MWCHWCILPYQARGRDGKWGKFSHSIPTFCVKKPNDKWHIVNSYNMLNAATIRHRRPFLGRMFFKTTWLVVLCIVHSTFSMDITNCSCERVIFRWRPRALRVVCYGNGWWYPTSYLTCRLHFIVWWRNVFVPIGIMHRQTLMTFLSEVVSSKADRVLETTMVICDPCSSACARMNCTQTRLNASLLHVRFLF